MLCHGRLLAHCPLSHCHAEAQFRIISQFALYLSTMGSGFIKGPLVLSPLVLGTMTSYLYDKTRLVLSPS